MKYWNLQTRIKTIKCFFVGVPLFSFLLEIFSTFLTLHCLKCLFHVNIHIDKVINVMFVENVSIWNVTSENISKKITWLFWVANWKYQYFWQLLQNQKVKVIARVSNNHYWSYTFLNPWSLIKFGKLFFKYWPENLKQFSLLLWSNLILFYISTNIIGAVGDSVY